MKRILVVDDEESIRLLYQEELQDRGYEVILAGDAEEAITKFTETSPHLVILDIKMSGRSGIDAMRSIRDQSRDVPIILSTAYGEYKQNFETWASDAYVVKSANLDNLLRTVQEILSRK